MRNMRKALSFALILALVLTSFSFTSATHTGTGASELSDIAGLPGAEHIMAGHSLGYIIGFPDGTFRPNELVNRAQFAAMVTRAMGIPDSALLGHTATPFQDTDGFGWAVPYLSFTHSRGIMLGDGHGNAMPGRTITMNEGMTMLLRAIGYTEGSQELVGTWPSNYVALATQHDLYRDIVGTSQHMDRQNAAIAIFNALTVQMVYVDLVGRTDRRWISHQDGIPANLANTGLNAMTTRGTLQLDMATMDHISVADRVGAFGWLFYDRHTGELIAFRQLSTAITGFMNADNTRFVAGGVNYSGPWTTTAGAVSQFWNGVPYVVSNAAQTQEVIHAFAGGGFPGNATDGRQVTLHVEIAGATVTRIHSILGWAADQAAVVSAADIRLIEEDHELLGAWFPDNFDQEIDYGQFQLIGVNCLRDIRANDVVYVYHSGYTITRVAVGREVVEGTMTEASNTRFVVDGTSYNYAFRFLTAEARGAATNFEDVFPYAGSDVTVRLDAFGNAFEVVIDGFDVGNFGIVRGRTPDGDARGQGVTLLTNDDAEIFYNIVGGNALSRFNPRVIADPGNVIPRRAGAMSGWGTGVNAGATSWLELDELVGYGLNAAGNINVLERATPTDIDVRSRTIARVETTGGLTRDVTIDANVAVFWPNAAGTEWNVGGIGDVDLSEFRSAGAQDGQVVFNTAGTRIVAMAIPHGFADADGDDIFGVINSWMNIGADARNFTGFFDGARTASTLRTADTRPDVTLGQVSFYRIATNAAGQITTLTDLVNPAAPRFVTRASEFPNATPAGASLGLQIIYRDAVDAGNLFVEVAGNQRVTLADDVVVYRATWSGGSPGVGNIVYAVSGAGINAVRGAAVVWAFNTTPNDADVTNEAHILIWMHSDDVPADWL